MLNKGVFPHLDKTPQLLPHFYLESILQFADQIYHAVYQLADFISSAFPQLDCPAEISTLRDIGVVTSVGALTSS